MVSLDDKIENIKRPHDLEGKDLIPFVGLVTYTIKNWKKLGAPQVGPTAFLLGVYNGAIIGSGAYALFALT